MVRQQASALADSEQRLAEFDRFTIFDQNLADGTVELGGNLIENLHRLDNADNRISADFGSYTDERWIIGTG